MRQRIINLAVRILNEPSCPSRQRQIFSALVMVGGFILAVVVKVARGHLEIAVPLWAIDSLPNFICGAVVPYAVLLGPRVIRLYEFLFFCLLIVCGLTVYELTQLAMPRRTFDLNDIYASAAGGFLPASLILGRALYIHCKSKTGGPAYPPANDF